MRRGTAIFPLRGGSAGGGTTSGIGESVEIVAWEGGDKDGDGLACSRPVNKMRREGVEEMLSHSVSTLR
jgi:hypothetical protein